MRDAPQVSPASVVLPEGGTVRAMTRWGTPVMHTPQQPVTSYDEELRALAADMTATMYAAEGVGLAADVAGPDTGTGGVVDAAGLQDAVSALYTEAVSA